MKTYRIGMVSCLFVFSFFSVAWAQNAATGPGDQTSLRRQALERQGAIKITGFPRCCPPSASMMTTAPAARTGLQTGQSGPKRKTFTRGLRSSAQRPAGSSPSWSSPTASSSARKPMAWQDVRNILQYKSANPGRLRGPFSQMQTRSTSQPSSQPDQAATFPSQGPNFPFGFNSPTAMPSQIQNNSPNRANTALAQTNSQVVPQTTDIITNTIWRADTVYHVTGTIHVQALLVIEPGTVVEFDPGCALRVNNGSVVIANGTPDNMILFISAWAYPLRIPISDRSPYYSAIYLDETASPCCQISFCMITNALVGIETHNVRLDNL